MLGSEVKLPIRFQIERWIELRIGVLQVFGVPALLLELPLNPLLNLLPKLDLLPLWDWQAVWQVWKSVDGRDRVVSQPMYRRIYENLTVEREMVLLGPVSPLPFLAALLPAQAPAQEMLQELG